MNAFKESPGKGSENGGSEALLSLLIADVLKTRETRELLGELIPELMRRFTGERSLMQRMMSPVEGFVKRKLTGPSNGEAAPALSSLFSDPRFAEVIRQFMPEIVTGLASALNKTVKNAKSFPPEERDAFVTSLLTGLSQISVGEFLTLFFQTVNEIHADNPLYFSERLEPGVTQLIEGLDIGELRDFVDHSHEDINALIKVVLNVLWKYPSKLVLLLTFTTDIVNLFSRSISELLSVLNRISPDLIADVVFSIFRGIDGKAIGKVIHEGAEIIRKIHVGSALIGEPGTTQLPTDLGRFVEEMRGAIDETILDKAKVALSEEKEIVSDTMRKIVKDNPLRLERRLQGYSRKKNSTFKEVSHILSAIEKMPETAVADAVEKAAENFETEEAAEIVNLFSALLNRIRQEKPSLVRDGVSRFLNALDLTEIREGIAGLSEEISEDLMPIGRAVIPQLVSGVCLALAPADDEFEEDAAQARALLRSLLQGEERVS